MAVLRPLLVIFWYTALISFTKLWIKSYDKKNAKTQKKQKNALTAKNITQIRSFLQNRKKNEMEIFAFCVITFEPIKI